MPLLYARHLLKFEDLEDIAVIVSPATEASRDFAWGYVSAVETWTLEPRLIRRYQDPG